MQRIGWWPPIHCFDLGAAMMDIVERLRRNVGNADINETAAANEIERLRKDNEGLKQELLLLKKEIIEDKWQ